MPDMVVEPASQPLGDLFGEISSTFRPIGRAHQLLRTMGVCHVLIELVPRTRERRSGVDLARGAGHAAVSGEGRTGPESVRGIAVDPAGGDGHGKYGVEVGQHVLGLREAFVRVTVDDAVFGEGRTGREQGRVLAGDVVQRRERRGSQMLEILLDRGDSEDRHRRGARRGERRGADPVRPGLIGGRGARRETVLHPHGKSGGVGRDADSSIGDCSLGRRRVGNRDSHLGRWFMSLRPTRVSIRFHGHGRDFVFRASGVKTIGWGWGSRHHERPQRLLGSGRQRTRALLPASPFTVPEQASGQNEKRIARPR